MSAFVFDCILIPKSFENIEFRVLVGIQSKAKLVNNGVPLFKVITQL